MDSNHHLNREKTISLPLRQAGDAFAGPSLKAGVVPAPSTPLSVEQTAALSALA